MIKRDKYGIIVQHSDDSTYGDGGDSCARTGIMALEHKSDKNLLSLFVTYDFQVVRHPHQFKWDNPKNTSRDQIVQFFASGINTLSAEEYAKKWFVNKDFLMPDVKLYLYKSALARAPIWLEILGTANMWLSLFWNTKLRPHEEMNQFCCMCLRFGSDWVKRLYKYHPDIEENIRSYWGGWRDQPEIGEVLINALRKKL